MSMPYLDILRFYLNAKTIYNVHSPFVFEFVTDVLHGHPLNDQLDLIETQRNQLLKSKATIDVVDYGAGSKTGGGNKRMLNDIAKTSVSGKTKCRWLYQMINKYQPKEIIELGTSLGISSAYMACATPQNITTFEGNPSSIEVARKVHSACTLNNIHIVDGQFSDTFPKYLSTVDHIDFAYIDGNHSESATISYFEMLKSKRTNNTILVFDDIYWSKGMVKAWKYICLDEQVRLSLDLFQMGIVFFDKRFTEKEHHALIKYSYKPFNIGIFG